MKSYLIEADNTATSARSSPSQSVFRTPFKLLQNFQQCQDSIVSKMSASSSALKSITNRQKRLDTSTTVAKSNKLLDTDCQSSKTKTSTIASRQKNLLNTRTNIKSPTQSKQDKNKRSDSACGDVNSVGSLTSSPKWSHIKNKFENGSSIDKIKLGRTTSLTNEENGSSKVQFNASKSMNSLLPDTKLSASKSKNSVIRKGEKNCNASQYKSDNSSLSKNKSKDESGIGKDKHFKPSSPKSSYLHNPKNVSSVKSNNLNKNSQLNTASYKQAPQNFKSSSKSSRLQKSLAVSSISLSSSSSKNSEVDDTHSISSTKSSNSPNNSQINNPSLCASDSKKSYTPKSFLSTTTPSSSPKNSHSSLLTENVSSLHNGLSTKRNVLANKAAYSRINKKEEEDSKLNSKQTTFNQNDQKQSVRKSFLSDKDRLLLHNISNINKNCKLSSATLKQNGAEVSDTTIKKATITENMEKIQDLVKTSPPSAKTIWVKDKAGNWIKKAETESKINIQSKVAGLRSKFLDSSKETVIPLSKCVTENNVPSKTPIRTLAKSSTTSSICDRTLIEDLSRNLEESHKIIPNSEGSKSRFSDGSTVIGSKPRKRNSVDSDAKLNIVQRAILSYEGNLSLLSPESQRRLKLVNEKVQAQTDDDKILQSKAPIDGLIRPAKESSSKKLQNNSQKKSVDQKVVGEPIVPTREFLNRYKNINKDLKKVSNTSEHKVSPRIHTEQNTYTSFSCRDTNRTTQVKVETANSNVSISKVTDSTAPCEKNRQNLILNLSESKPCLKSADSQDGKMMLQPNSSFLWRCSTVTSSELSKSSTTSSVSLTSSDYRNYYDVQNYYSTLDVEIDKRSEVSEDPIYIDSQESNSSENNYATSNGAYENVQPKMEFKNSKFDILFLSLYH